MSNARTTYPVPFVIGDGSGDIMLDVKYITDGFARDADSCCAFCHGDPCAEYSPPESRIAQYHERHAVDRVKYPGCYDTCPCCNGRPS